MNRTCRYVGVHLPAAAAAAADGVKGLSDDPSGLIFDDPITSLDHGVREHVARRLVQAAKDRPVIIFTHHLAFLADLREQAGKILDVRCTFRTLTALEQAGFVENAEPFGARSITDRIAALRRLVADLERSSTSGQVGEFLNQAREFYGYLRSTWERFIEGGSSPSAFGGWSEM